MADERVPLRTREAQAGFKREQEAILEYFKQAHDTQKHLATLSAGAIVLIATFLSDIFPKTTGGVLDVGLPIKLLIIMSFICFGVSLAMSAYLMRIYPKRHLHTAKIGPEDYEGGWHELYSTSRAVYGWDSLRPIALYSFPIGLAAFGIAVLVTLL